MPAMKTLLVGFTLFLLLSTCSSESRPGEDSPPNIILIFTDDLGYGDLSNYGNPTIRTPHLEQMAEEGIKFNSFYAAAPVCTPSRAALLTGRYPIRHTPFNFGPESTDGLPINEVTIADLLSEQGYATLAVGKWHLGHLPEYLPTANGFDHFYGLPYSNDMILPWCPWLSETDTLFMYEDDQPAQVINFDQEGLTETYTEQAIQFINNHREEPFFLYLAHNMPHLPISTGDRFRGKSKGGLYGDVIEALDWSTGEILSTLQELDLDEHTIVVFTSDNGPWQNLPDRMLQRGIEPWHSGSAGPLRGAKATTWEGGFRVPCMVRWPGRIPAGQVSNAMVSTMDLFVTLSQLGGATIPADRPIDGHDIWPLIADEKPDVPTEPFFYLWLDSLQAVREGPWKLRIAYPEPIQLYHLDRDPAERYNVALQHPERVKALRQRMVTFAEETGAKMSRAK